jgi:hypothetical protein
MFRMSASLLGLVLLFPAIAVADSADSFAKTVAPYVDSQTIALVHVDATKVDVNALVTRLQEATKLDAEEFAPFKEAAGSQLAKFTRAGGKDFYLLWNLADLPHASLLVVPLGEGADADALTELFRAASSDRLAKELPFSLASAETAKLEGALVMGSKAALARLRAGKHTTRPEVAGAFGAVANTAGQLLLLPTPEVRRVLQEVMPSLPREVGDGPSSVVSQGLQWLALGVDFPPQTAVHVVIQSPDHAAAEALRGLIVRIYQAIGHDKQLRQRVPRYEQVARLLTPTVQEDRLTLRLDAATEGAEEFAAALSSLGSEAGRRNQCTNNLKQIVLALWNYHDVHKGFPAIANFDKQGKPLLSWRVHILPFLEQDKLYKEFHLDEPWDSAHNKPLIERMPDVYRCPSMKRSLKGQTTYLGPVGANMMFTGTPETLAIKDVTDGTSNTIFLVDADDAHAVIWTKPEDWEIKPDQILKALLGHHPGGFLAAFADGSVHFLPQTIDANTLHALFTRNGGEVVNIP